MTFWTFGYCLLFLFDAEIFGENCCRCVVCCADERRWCNCVIFNVFQWCATIWTFIRKEWHTMSTTGARAKFFFGVTFEPLLQHIVHHGVDFRRRSAFILSRLYYRLPFLEGQHTVLQGEVDEVEYVF